MPSDAASLSELMVEAKRAVDAARAHHDQVQAKLDALRAGKETAAARLGELVGGPLAEVKRMAHCPPAPVRRTLAATWLMLNCDSCSRSAARFDDRREWHRVQKMLVDEAFISRILNFDSERLAKAPRVLRILRLLCGEARAAPVGRGPLAPEAVERASRPCGALFRWLLAVLAEQEAGALLEDLRQAEAEAQAAEQRFRKLVTALARLETEAALARRPLATSTPPRAETPVPKVQPRPKLRPSTAPEPTKRVPAHQELPIRELMRRRVHGEEPSRGRQPLLPPVAWMH